SFFAPHYCAHRFYTHHRLTLIGRPFFTEVIGGADGVLAGTAVAITNNSMLGILLSFHSTIKEKRCGTM
ncbi:MAG TPA: hypothetical protein PLV63_12675, partial [Niabella sp.]|nr:hypothetical protein [Niabella sp.]